MIEITDWTNTFLNALNDQFGDRVWFVGLQGSFARGEATENSDIDMVVILDEISASDVAGIIALRSKVNNCLFFFYSFYSPTPILLASPA